MGKSNKILLTSVFSSMYVEWPPISGMVACLGCILNSPFCQRRGKSRHLFCPISWVGSRTLAKRPRYRTRFRATTELQKKLKPPLESTGCYSEREEREKQTISLSCEADFLRPGSRRLPGDRPGSPPYSTVRLRPPSYRDL